MLAKNKRSRSKLRRRILLTVSLSFVCTVFSTLHGESRSGTEINADVLVQQLRGLPAPIPVVFTGGICEKVPCAPDPLPPTEQKRWQVYDKLHALGGVGVQGLARALRDPDTSLRRNATLALQFLAEGSGRIASSRSKIDVRPALPALIVALQDRDELVRSWAAQAIGAIGPNGASAVPALIKLLDRDEGALNGACIALRRIGPAAKSALPALKRLLSDPDADVRKMASSAVTAIQGNSADPSG